MDRKSSVLAGVAAGLVAVMLGTGVMASGIDMVGVASSLSPGAVGSNLTLSGALLAASLTTTGNVVVGGDIRAAQANGVFFDTAGTKRIYSDGSNIITNSVFAPSTSAGVDVGTAALRWGTIHAQSAVMYSGASTVGGLVPGVIGIAVTSVGNVGVSAPDDLQTITYPASALISAGYGIRISAWGTCANNANAKTFTLNFGSQVILTHACTISVAGETWRIQAEITRTGASAQKWFSTYYGSTGAAGAFEFDPESGTATQTETANITIKMQTTASTADNDIVQLGMIVETL